MFARVSVFATVAAFGAFLSTNVLAQSESQCQTEYSVVSGDNCVALAAKFNVTYNALVAANPKVDQFCDNLSVGEQLCIPCTSQYTVQSGDVCDSIATKFKVTTAALEAANPNIDPLCDNLLPGEDLCIPVASS